MINDEYCRHFISLLNLKHSFMKKSNKYKYYLKTSTLESDSDVPDSNISKKSKNGNEIQMYERFNDESVVDFVLVYDTSTSKKNPSTKAIFDEESKIKIRQIFERNLTSKGLDLETESINGLTFVKIRASKSVLKKYCEHLKLKMPLKETKEEQQELMENFNLISGVKTAFVKLIKYFVTIDPRKHYHAETILYAEYNSDKYYMFDEESAYFFTPTVRIIVIDFILNRVKWTDNEEDLHSVGIRTLIDDDVYKAAYPVHEGDYRENGNLRNRLYTDWAILSNWIRLQPIDDVKNYLGVKCGFYFAWLGFYTQLLIPAAIFGIVVVLYGLITLEEDPNSSFVCNNGKNFTMCPLCNNNCQYWNLYETCNAAKMSYLFDNTLSVVFAFLMSVWATFLLELWKRHAAVLLHCWGLSDYTSQSEHPRPQFLAKLAGAKKMRKNAETDQMEPVLSFWMYKLPTVVFSYTIVIFFILVVLAAAFSIVLYRMWMTQIGVLVENNAPSVLREHSKTFISVTAGIMNLTCIMVLSSVYHKVANYLTVLELPRTQNEFDNSLSIKMYIFQFVNYYASIMYIAFFKGKFVGYPKEYNTILNFRQEECTGGGCITELSIQLAIIMVGQQIYGSILEIVAPAIKNWFNRIALKKKEKEDEEAPGIGASKEQWVEDYKLLPWDEQSLFSEYLEIAIQFGFVTLFACAFPLAPLFALINNVFELRLDAQKMLKYYRRPVPYRVPHIGVWYRIFDIVSKLAVVFNAAIIAFSSNFIPLLVYILEDYHGSFVEFSTSSFRTKDLPSGNAHITNGVNVTECRYYGYRDSTTYDHTKLHWKILAYRLLFIFIFQNSIFVLKIAAQWLIPDVPRKLTDRIRKEHRLITDLMIKRETEAARSSGGKT